MKAKQPKISLILYTYNRAQIVVKAIESVLNQTYQDFELILVNNGSEDNTYEVVEKYRNNEKVRIFHLDKNRGGLGGLNFSLDQIKGEWFAILGDDDTILKNAFETLIKVPEEIDPTITAISCNAIDSQTGKFVGKGLDHDQYLPIDVIINKTGGDFFAITKTELLGDKRFNEKLIGTSNAFWYQIDAIANRYYIHKGLKIYNTGTGSDNTESSRQQSLDVKVRTRAYKALLEEKFYWQILKKHNRKRFIARTFRGMWFMRINGETEASRQYKAMMLSARPDIKHKILIRLVNGFQPGLLKRIYHLIEKNKLAEFISRIFLPRYSKIN